MSEETRMAERSAVLRELADRVRDWYGLRGVPMDDVSVLRECVTDLEASHAIYLRLEPHVRDLINAIESVQDWGGTEVGCCIDSVNAILTYKYKSPS